MENKANTHVHFKAQDKSFEKSHLPTFYTYMSITPYNLGATTLF